MRVLVEQLWKDGVQIDARERSMSGEKITGHLFISSHEGERFAALLMREHFEEPREELVPRLWALTLLEVKGDRFKLRGVQRSSGRLCNQEWDCVVLKQR